MPSLRRTLQRRKVIIKINPNEYVNIFSNLLSRYCNKNFRLIKYFTLLTATIESTLAESAKVIEERERTVEKKDMLERLNIEEQQK